MASHTSTPVGQPLTSRRPALRSSVGSKARAFGRSASSRCRVAVSWPSRCSATWRICSSSVHCTTSDAAPNTSACRAGSARKACARVTNRWVRHWLGPSPDRPVAAVCTWACSASEPTPASKALKIPGVSMVCAALCFMCSAAAATKRSSPAPSRAITRPGLVQNWPAPWVSEATKPCASASPRACKAAGKRNTGLIELISA
ncbi:hypothetical protein D3C72_1688320 [compost metagenome]